MALTKAKFENFTAFEDLTVEFSPGINAFIGANGTGKTHLMKACYAACDVSTTGDHFEEKLVRVFLPSGRRSSRLVKQMQKDARGTVTLCSGERSLSATFSTTYVRVVTVSMPGVEAWSGSPIESVYIPAKDMLANAPGFLSLYAAREVHFEEVYRDICTVHIFLLFENLLTMLTGRCWRASRMLLAARLLCTVRSSS